MAIVYICPHENTQTFLYKKAGRCRLSAKAKCGCLARSSINMLFVSCAFHKSLKTRSCCRKLFSGKRVLSVTCMFPGVCFHPNRVLFHACYGFKRGLILTEESFSNSAHWISKFSNSENFELLLVNWNQWRQEILVSSIVLYFDHLWSIGQYACVSVKYRGWAVSTGKAALQSVARHCPIANITLF